MLVAFALGTLHLHMYLNGHTQKKTKCTNVGGYIPVRSVPDAYLLPPPVPGIEQQRPKQDLC